MGDEYDVGLGGKSGAGDQAVHQGAKQVGKKVGEEVGKAAAKEGAKTGAKAAAHGAGQAAGTAAPVVGNLVAAAVVEAIDKAWKFRKPLAILAGFALLLGISPMFLFQVTIASAEQAVANLTIKPVAGIALAAYSAASECDFAGSADTSHFASKLSTVYLVAMAFEATGTSNITSVSGVTGGSLFFGSYRNPLPALGLPPGYTPMQGTAGLNLNTAGLTAGGDTAQLINATSGLTPQAWTSIWPLTPGEHGVGFLLITPKDWRNDLVQSELPAGVNAATLSPWRPQDAFLVVACHLKWQVDQFLKAGQAALTAVTSALVSFGNTVLQIWETAWPIIQNLIADITNPIKLAADILSLTSSLLTQFIDNGNIYFDYLTGFLTGNLVGAGGNGISIPGGMCAVSTANPSGNCPYPYLKPIGIPAFYYDPPKFASYDAYAFGIVNIVDKNQCTYGAVAEWLTLHQSDSHWYGPTVSSQHPFTGAIDAGHFYGTAVAAGYTVSSAPVSGALVVYKNYAFGPSFPAGHLATVVGVSADGRHFMVMDQNWLNPEENYAEIGPGFPPYRWNLAGFDLRTDYWPNAGIAGFIWGPPGTKVG